MTAPPHSRANHQPAREDPVPDALSLLDHEWDTFCSSRRSSTALARWQAGETVPDLPDIESLMTVIQDRRDLDGRDRLIYRLVVLACDDHDARLVVLASLRPGLHGVAQRYRHWWGWEETASMTFVAALERVATYPADRVHRPAANIVRDVHNRLHRVRARELTADRKLGLRACPDELESVAVVEAEAASDELTELLDDAVATRRLTTEDAALIYELRVLDLGTDQVAQDRGHQPGTIRSHRRLAEQRLALITRSALGIHGAVA